MQVSDDTRESKISDRINNEMKVSDYIVDVLSKNGIDTIFGHLGGFNADIVDSIYSSKKHYFVLNYHEQASAFAANAFSLVKEDISVATSSGAPSSCNLIAGIANAYFDSIPCVFIVGSVHSKAVRPSKEIRQNAFEEIDMVSMVSDITKFAVKVTDPQDIRYYLEKAFYIAKEGRKGPVLLDIPYDIARSIVDKNKLKGFVHPENNDYDEVDMEKIKKILKNAKKPLFLLGGGARSKDCKEKIKKLLNKVKIPVVASLCGLDVLPHNHECFVGFIGHYGHRYANFALANCDCLIVLGSRLDERQLGGYKTKLSPDVKVIRVDIDKAELGRKILETVSIYSSTENFLGKLIEENFEDYDFHKWIKLISIWKKRYPSYDLSSKEVNAINFLHTISDYLSDDTVICSDVGQNQMCVAQSLRLDNNRKLLNSAGYGSMGYSLPAAIGAAYALKNTSILSINGDGGLQMNIQELQTLKRDNLPVNIIVLNNNCLGMIRRLQENIFDNRTSASIDGYSVPDYSSIAKAYGIKYLRIDSVEKYELARDFISNRMPTLIEVFLPQKMKNNPEPGTILDRQTPLLSDEEYDLIKKECLF